MTTARIFGLLLLASAMAIPVAYTELRDVMTGADLIASTFGPEGTQFAALR